MRERAVLELDVKLTADRVPVVIHDDTLDRTTTCAGPVSAVTAAAFKACRADLLGSGGTTAPAPVTADVSTLAEVLAYAKDAVGLRVPRRLLGGRTARLRLTATVARPDGSVARLTAARRPA